MVFPTPATQDEMYEILKDIFYYYRIRREADTGVTLNALSLTRMTFTPPTDAERRTKAQTALKSSQEERLAAYRKKLSDEIATLTAEVSAVATEKEILKSKANESYAAATAKAERDAIKRGIAQSSAALDRIADIATALAAEIAAIEANASAKTTALQAKITALTADYNGAATYFADIFEYEILAKIDELKAKEEETAREVFKYNNSLDEKEQRSANSVITATRQLELRYMDVSSDFFSKDELVEMGYYQDVIDCVCAYYDTLSAVAAYQGIAHDTRAAIYLDDYYANVVYMYRTLANS